MIHHSDGPTGPAPLGWGDDRYDPSSASGSIPDIPGDARLVAGEQEADSSPASSGVFDETSWWGNCANTWHEEEKQIVYARRMGLAAQWGGAHPPTYDLRGASVIDIGGGPVSILLKCLKKGRAVVADPGGFPEWVIARYATCDIEFWQQPGEEIDGYSFDEVWLYNVLQHVQNPLVVIQRARALGKIIRIFDWIDFEPYDGHPHQLDRDLLDEWLEGKGYVTRLDERGCVGTAYYGVFST